MKPSFASRGQNLIFAASKNIHGFIEICKLVMLGHYLDLFCGVGDSNPNLVTNQSFHCG